MTLFISLHELAGSHEQAATLKLRLVKWEHGGLHGGVIQLRGGLKSVQSYVLVVMWEHSTGPMVQLLALDRGEGSRPPTSYLLSSVRASPVLLHVGKDLNCLCCLLSAGEVPMEPPYNVLFAGGSRIGGTKWHTLLQSCGQLPEGHGVMCIQ